MLRGAFTAAALRERFKLKYVLKMLKATELLWTACLARVRALFFASASTELSELFDKSKLKG